MKSRDSIRSEKLDSQTMYVRQLAAERLADSLRREELERRVQELRNDEYEKKQELISQLNKLKQQDSLRHMKQRRQIDSLRHFVKGIPVVFNRDTLFYLFTRQGSFTPVDRALAIGVRLQKLGDQLSFSADSMKLATAEQTTDIIYRDLLIMSVSEQDALWQNKTRDGYAAELKAIIVKAVRQYQKETNWQTWLKELLLALLVIGIAVLLIYGVNRFFRWINGIVTLKKSFLHKGIRIRNYEVLNSERQLGLILSGLTILKWLVVLLVIYLAFPVLFGIFPFTRDISTTLLNYILAPVRKIGIAVWDYIPNLITIVVLALVFRFVLRSFRYIKTEIERGQLKIPGFYTDWANPTYQIIRVLVLAFMLIVIFPYLPGSDSPIFKGVSVFMGILFTFGSAGALGNVVAGLVLTYMRAFKTGDRVKIGEVTGDVLEKTLLVTRVRTIKNEIISIPNSTVMGTHTINYSSEAAIKGLIINTTVTIGYDVPWRHVHELLINAAIQTVFIEQEPAPFVLQTSLDDYYVSYNINAYTREPNKQAVIYSSLHANIQDCFNKAGVEIMSPHYRAVRDGNMSTMPPEYLPEDYEAPVFRVPKRTDSDALPPEPKK
ncbi:mechanosensitive ion channel domain-containing protein [Mucilaginibacter lacusdianchii]|uniref:mechanosensitive ion channel domain-containing protein n=1 Tax=Mucilaginibacter lacusdianchii TaxID=2684211 RepID=UPI001E42B435|nr:mechanosensitive ion channel domain-containing protein [Mucilaginibacter sp. JXJ CY 39]